MPEQKKRFAEDTNYFDTTVSPSKSMGEIHEMLEAFGAEGIMVGSGHVNGKPAWLVRFGWLGKPYRFVFTPLPCKSPSAVRSFGGKKRAFEEQARFQMGRIAVYFVKAILTAAEAHPHALFGFMELEVGTGANRMHPTAGELNADRLLAALPEIDLPQIGMDYDNEDPQS
jgi:hypothetical protein